MQRNQVFVRDNYNAIVKIIEPKLILEAIEKVLTIDQIDQRYPEYLDVTRNEELARQFLWFYKNPPKNQENQEEKVEI